MACTCDEPGRPWVASLSVSVVLCEFTGDVSLFQSRCLGEDVGKRVEPAGFRCMEVMTLDTVVYCLRL